VFLAAMETDVIIVVCVQQVYIDVLKPQDSNSEAVNRVVVLLQMASMTDQAAEADASVGHS
jgi:hypothetical protein